MNEQMIALLPHCVKWLVIVAAGIQAMVLFYIVFSDWRDCPFRNRNREQET